MTYQEFNHIYFKFTNNEKGIRPMDKISTNGFELKEFVEFAIKNIHQEKNQQLSFDTFNFESKLVG